MIFININKNKITSHEKQIEFKFKL